MLAKLAAFKVMPKHGHCKVPQKHPDEPKLGRWVGSQRTYKKKLEASHPGQRITKERVAKLDELGFEWVVGQGKR